MESVALRIGRSWRWDPEVLARLVEAGEDGVERSLREVRDTLEVLVGGRNIAADASEDALFPVLYDLLTSLGDLHRGGRRKAIIPFRDEPWELVVERRGDQALLSFYGAGATRVVAARNASVSFGELIRSVAGAAGVLAEELESLCPVQEKDPYLRAFRDASAALLASPPRPAGALTASRPAAGGGPRRRRRRGGHAGRLLWVGLAPDLLDDGLRNYDGEHAYDLHSLLCTGDLSFETPDTCRVLAGGYPFLAAESLVGATETVLRAFEGEPGRHRAAIDDGHHLLTVSVDGEGGQVRIEGDAEGWGRALTCGVMDFARAALDATREIADAILERNPAHRRNRRLTDLLSEIAELQQWVDDLGTMSAPPTTERSGPPPTNAPLPPQARIAVSVRMASFQRVWSREIPGLEARNVRLWGSTLVGIADGRLELTNVATGGRAGDLADDEAPVVSVAPAGDRLVIGRHDGELLCHTGHHGVAWAADLGGPGATAGLSAVAVGDRIVVGTADGSLRAFNAREGRPLWRFDAPRSSGFELSADGRHVYAAADDRSLYALDVEDGRLTWRIRSGGGFTVAPTPLGDGSLLALTGDGVVPEGRIMALSTDEGRTLWETRVGQSCPRPPTQDGQGVLLCARSGDEDSLIRIDMTNGRTLWRRTWECAGIDDASQPVLVDGLACVQDDAGVIRAYDSMSGALAWSTNLATDGPIYAVHNLDPIAGRSLLFAATDRLVVLSTETGEELSEAPIRISGPGALVAVGPRRVVLTHGDRMEAHELGSYLGLLQPS